MLVKINKKCRLILATVLADTYVCCVGLEKTENMNIKPNPLEKCEKCTVGDVFRKLWSGQVSGAGAAAALKF